MAVTLSIKNVPDTLADALRERAARKHRSMQGELMAILEASVSTGRAMTPHEFLEEIRALGISTPNESVDMIRQDRDTR